MNVGNLVMPNTKGQVVIPSKIRKQLGITPEVPLRFTVMGSGIFVLPMTVSPKNLSTDNRAVLEVLKRTRGAWGPETAEEKRLEVKRRKLELAASKRARDAW